MHEHCAGVVVETPTHAEAERVGPLDRRRPDLEQPQRRVGIEPATSVRSSLPIACSGTRITAPSQLSTITADGERRWPRLTAR